MVYLKKIEHRLRHNPRRSWEEEQGGSEWEHNSFSMGFCLPESCEENQGAIYSQDREW